jgi:PDZ domain-containing protein
MTLMPVPYVLETPGPTLDTLGQADGVELIQIEQSSSHEITGQLRLTTVGAYGLEPGSLTVFELVKGYFDSSDGLLPYDLLYPDHPSNEEREAESAEQMNSSQELATAAALGYLGMDVGVLVDETLTDSAKAVLRSGDLILRVDGQDAADYSRLRALMETVAPGSEIELEIERAGVTVSVRLTTAEAESGAGSLLGIAVDFDFPVEVKFGIEEIGGPSAGSMFALGIIDKLGPIDLAGGHVIAGTGTVAPSGEIGPIGGIEQKMIAAKRDGAEFFLAPAANCAELLGHEPAGLRVIKVSSLSEATAALSGVRSGALDDLPRCG